LRIRPSLRARARRQGDPAAAPGRQPQPLPRGFPHPAARYGCLLPPARRRDHSRRRLPGPQRPERRAPGSLRRGARPVRRPADDGSYRDAHAAVAAVPAGVPRVPADARHGGLSRALDGSGGGHAQAAGLGDTNITHFRDLAVFGEQILLSVRYGAWSTVDRSDQAKVWANFWRPQIQGYIHAYESVTGIDLSAPTRTEQDRSVITMQPSALIQRRLLEGPRSRPQLSGNGATPIAATQPQGLRKRLEARKAARD